MKHKVLIEMKRGFSDQENVWNKFVEYGLYSLVILSPLPMASVPEWAILGIQLVVMVLAGVYLLFLSEKNTGSSSQSQTLRWPRFLFVLFFGYLVLQIVPLPRFLIKLLSPNTYGFHEQFSVGLAGTKFLSLSLVPHETFREGLELLAYVLIGFLIIKTVRSRVRVKRLIYVLMAIGLFEAFYGIFELTRENPRILFYKKTFSLDVVTGTFVNQNHLVGYLCMIIPLVIGLIISRMDFEAMSRLNFRYKIIHLAEKGFALNLVFMAFLLVMAVAVLLSRSRAGLFLVAFALFMFFQLSYMFFGKLPFARKWIRRLLVVVLLVITFVFLYIGVDATIERFSLDRVFQEGRTQFWVNTVNAIKDFPLFGTGLGTYLSVYPAYEKGRLYGRLVHAHNDYLEYFMELGLIGFLLLFGGVGALAIKSFLLWRKRRDPEVKGIGMGCFVALIVIGIHSLTDFNLHIPANMLLFTVILSLGYSVSRLRHKDVPVE